MWPRLERLTTLLSWYLVHPPVRRCVGARYRPVPGAQDEGPSGRLAPYLLGALGSLVLVIKVARATSMASRGFDVSDPEALP